MVHPGGCPRGSTLDRSNGDGFGVLSRLQRLPARWYPRRRVRLQPVVREDLLDAGLRQDGGHNVGLPGSCRPRASAPGRLHAFTPMRLKAKPCQARGMPVGAMVRVLRVEITSWGLTLVACPEIGAGLEPIRTALQAM